MPLLLLLLLAPMSAQGGILTGDRVAVGVNSDGSLVDDDGLVGITYDPSDAPMGGDMLTPGRKWEAFGLRWRRDGANVEHTSVGPHLGGGIDFTWEPVRHNGVFTWQEGDADLGDVKVHVSVDLPVGGDVFWVNVDVTAEKVVEGLQVYRTVDSDSDFFVNNSYSTANETGDGYALSASTRTYGKALALGVRGGTGSICSWCSTADSILAGQSVPRDGDFVIAVISEARDLAPDQTHRLRFAYALATSGELAVERIEAAIFTDDMDGDGVSGADGDCDDRDDLVYPGAAELPDEVDNDCNGDVDEGTAARDDDGDGYSEWDGDCDDDDKRVHPGAEAVEGIRDANCDGLADEGGFRDDEPPDGWGDGGAVLEPGEEREGVGTSCASPAGGLSLLGWLLLLPILRRRTER